MRDPMDDLLAKLRRLREMAGDIASSAQAAVNAPMPTQDKPEPLRVRMYTIADFHRTHRSLQ